MKIMIHSLKGFFAADCPYVVRFYHALTTIGYRQLLVILRSFPRVPYAALLRVGGSTTLAGVSRNSMISQYYRTDVHAVVSLAYGLIIACGMRHILLSPDFG